MIKPRLAAAAFALVITAHSHAIAAQAAAGPVTAMLVLSPTPLTDGHVRVRRHTATQPYDLIIVDKGATETDVSSAVGLLGVLRARSGEARTPGGTIMNAPPRGGQKPAPDHVRIAKSLHDLPKAASRSIQGVGKVHAVPISVP